MRHFAGGVLSTMPELTALMAPTPNSYRRYVPYSWAGTTATWGIDNRSVGLRAICEGPDGTRLEHRQPGGDANPYIASRPPRRRHARRRAEDRASRPDRPRRLRAAAGGGAAPPVELGEALDLLERSEVARDWLGADFVSHYVEMKRAELRAQAVAVTDWEVARYLEPL